MIDREKLIAGIDHHSYFGRNAYIGREEMEQIVRSGELVRESDSQFVFKQGEIEIALTKVGAGGSYVVKTRRFAAEV